MTKEEFWKAIDNCGKSPALREKMPELFQQQEKEGNLSLLAVSKNGALQVLRAKGRRFLYCVTDKKTRLPAGCRAVEMGFGDLFLQAVDQDCEGFAFLFGDAFVGVELADIAPAK